MCHQSLLVLPVPHSFCGMTADYSPVGVSPVVTQMSFFIYGQAIKQGENKKFLGFVINYSLHGFTSSLTQAEKNTKETDFMWKLTRIQF